MSNEKALRKKIEDLAKAYDRVGRTECPYVAAELRAALALPASAHGAEPAGYEHQRAIMEAERNDSLQQSGFAATVTVRAFERGFTNGWDRRAALAAAPAAQAGAVPVQAEPPAGRSKALGLLRCWFDSTGAIPAGSSWRGELETIVAAAFLDGREHGSNDTVLRPAPSQPAPAQPDAADAAHGPMTSAPKYGAPYWATMETGAVEQHTWGNGPVDRKWLRARRMFRTEADARAALAAQAVAKGGD